MDYNINIESYIKNTNYKTIEEQVANLIEQYQSIFFNTKGITSEVQYLIDNKDLIGVTLPKCKCNKGLKVLSPDNDFWYCWQCKLREEECKCGVPKAAPAPIKVENVVKASSGNAFAQEKVVWTWNATDGFISANPPVAPLKINLMS